MNIIKKIKSFFILLRADIQLRYAIREADRKYRLRKCRFYVIPNFNHQLITRSWSEIKQLRKNGYFSPHAGEGHFIMESFYYTPNRFGLSLSDSQRKKKRLSWLNYVSQVRHLI